MKKLKIISALLVATLTFGIGTQVSGQDLSGKQIIEKVYNRATGEDQTSDLAMTLENKSGDQRVRKIKQFTKDLGDVEKRIMFFVSPADVKNTSFMSWSYDSDKSDDQWIYLPALKKTKRISSDSKSDYFMGSDFTYDDLGDRKLEDDTHKLLREETLDGKDCYVVESVSKDEDYMYSKIQVWVDKSNFIGIKKEFYDEDEDLLKILSIKDIKQASGVWIITNSEMKNVQKNHKTTISLNNVQINSGISAAKFSERMMMRGL
ncbi:MAG: outer membrane lipoprotein-sorting protein [Bacteroidetes bacterium]|nr:outer membrane lipoprotein-sorting protein [Bacteroidota bacterium]MBT7466664.1 outer membrane lipoprotein-sorting protein [Bacteroidota bacterium]